MDLKTLLTHIDADTARAFVTATRHMIDALLIEGERVHQAQTPDARDYNTADLPRTTPAGGWLTHSELRDTARRLSEAIASEKWTDGVLFAFQALRTVGGL